MLVRSCSRDPPLSVGPLSTTMLRLRVSSLRPLIGCPIINAYSAAELSRSGSSTWSYIR